MKKNEKTLIRSRAWTVEGSKPPKRDCDRCWLVVVVMVVVLVVVVVVVMLRWWWW